jgi:hypothetical protein
LVLNWIIGATNIVIKGLGQTLQMIFYFFPDSPFAVPVLPPGTINLGYITWLIPVGLMIEHLLALLTAILVFYAIRIVARWVKVIGQ